ncbi:verrucotoxin subunit beta-like, partial [Polypterus senegalus]|uniref:verrucotoxin subunit beta-like n=1 Tax=Polypterus senegalus TaxID=55291 RepID=UPI001964CF2E
FNIIKSDSLDEKTSILNMTASLKASFLCGLIEVGGSAKYLNDTKSSKRQSRVTLHYSMTTRMEQLTMNHLGRQNVIYPEVFKIRNRPPMLSRPCYSDKKFADHFNCTFYGDFALHQNPTSYQDAMEIYTNLPNKLGKDDELAVPIQVWLYPLKNLNSQAAQLVQEISVALVSKSQEVLEEIDERIKRCEGANEEQLADILKKKEESPFKKRGITSWLDKREKEISMITNVFNQIKEMKLDIVINGLDTLIYNNNIKNIVCLTFTSLHVSQSYISVMKRYLQAPCQSSDHLSEPSEELIIQNFRKYSQQFIEFAEINQNSMTTRFRSLHP